MCKSNNSIKTFVMVASIFLITMLAFDRYWSLSKIRVSKMLHFFYFCTVYHLIRWSIYIFLWYIVYDVNINISRTANFVALKIEIWPLSTITDIWPQMTSELNILKRRRRERNKFTVFSSINKIWFKNSIYAGI